jgi:hypothetical protein
MMTMTHGQERSVERTIRLWIAQLERSQRQGGGLGRIEAPSRMPVAQGQRAVASADR